MAEKIVKVGLVGFGTVGAGVAKLLIEQNEQIAARCGVHLELACVVDKDTESKRPVELPAGLLTDDLNKLLEDDSIKIGIELVGGTTFAKDLQIAMLKAGKDVVTANKALLAKHGEEIFTIASKYGSKIGFEASVCGAIPIIKILRESFAANRINALYGIVNGTCNFILSKMADQNFTLKEALSEAKAKGIAEANPTLDIEGDDSCHKLCILAMLAFGKFVKPEDVYVEGIKDLCLQDIVYAGNWGYAIKLLAVAKRKGDLLELRVHPTLISMRHLLSAVKGEDNAVFIKGDMIGESMVYGKGAGRFPAASSVVSDILDISKSINASSAEEYKHLKLTSCKGIHKIAKIGDLVTRYYIRFSAIDNPGVLAAISTILAKNKISIATVSQKERKKGQAVPIVMVTHEAEEASMKKALKVIDGLKFVKEKTVRIRIER